KSIFHGPESGLALLNKNSFDLNTICIYKYHTYQQQIAVLYDMVHHQKRMDRVQDVKMSY
ncbi:unnamed protein product, partial [Rotaria socialis]